MRHLLAALLFVAAAFAPAFSAGAAEGEETIDLTPAIRAAESWLAVVDQGRYGESWEMSAPLFKATIAKLRWETSAQDARGPLGIPVARKVKSVRPMRNLPGAPEGEYVIIEFDTRFERRPLSVETVTPVRDRDGSWKVSGYFIR